MKWNEFVETVNEKLEKQGIENPELVYIDVMDFAFGVDITIYRRPDPIIAIGQSYKEENSHE